MVGLTTALDSIWVQRFQAKRFLQLDRPCIAQFAPRGPRSQWAEYSTKGEKVSSSPSRTAWAFHWTRPRKKARNMSVLPVCIQQGRPFDQIWRFVHKMEEFSFVNHKSSSNEFHGHNFSSFNIAFGPTGTGSTRTEIFVKLFRQYFTESNSPSRLSMMPESVCEMTRVLEVVSR